MHILDNHWRAHKGGGEWAEFHPYRSDTPFEGSAYYYQFVSNDDYYFMTREAINGSVTTTTFLLSKDISTLDASWTNRATLTYLPMHEILGD